MKIKRGCAFILVIFLVAVLILFTLALLGIFFAPRQDASGFDHGYPAPYPAPVDPWCEEAALLDLPAPWWCPVIGEAVSTVAVEPENTPAPQAVNKIGGRMKKGGKG